MELYNKYYWHNSQFNADGDKTRWGYGGRYTEWMSELKAEYGLTDRFNLLASIPYKHAIWRDHFNHDVSSDVGDSWVKAKYRFFDETTMPFVFSGQGGIGIHGPYDPHDSPALGSHEIAGEIRLIASRSFSILPSYGGVEVAYRPRLKDPANEIPYFLEYGYYPTNWVMFKGTLDGVKAIRGTGIKEDYTKWTASIILSLRGTFGTFRKKDLEEEAMEEAEIGWPAVLWWLKKYIREIELGYGNTFIGKNASAGSEIFFKATNQF
ncbi:MAG: hypothetical protein Q8O36_00945 [Candidatus Omnitrophota bacterium]|nr:hypothetical protein [Candidatus Omnitrophota bacterium]